MFQRKVGHIYIDTMGKPHRVGGDGEAKEETMRSLFCFLGLHRWLGVPVASILPRHQYCPRCGKARYRGHYYRRWLSYGASPETVESWNSELDGEAA